MLRVIAFPETTFFSMLGSYRTALSCAVHMTLCIVQIPYLPQENQDLLQAFLTWTTLPMVWVAYPGSGLSHLIPPINTTVSRYSLCYRVCGCWHLATLGCQTGLFSWHLAKNETETLTRVL